MGKAASDWPTGNIVRDMVSGVVLLACADLQIKKEAYPRAVFSEGLAIDYKWFDKWDIAPRYPFGYGLR